QPWVLRVGVRGGGCSGLSYYLELAEAPRAGDTELDAHGITVVVDPKSLKHITGLVLDYSTKNLLEGGWKFSNPNAARSCGCGTSFTPAAHKTSER
ncbi:MAG: iron-sulfur cluster assembly accessory protein, partial [Armatimonadetes bacterium]|nr:iron-sulfur cluster assembly accessory protein [Armatimonadota bacterium]